jgi:hypothetical protein
MSVGFRFVTDIANALIIAYFFLSVKPIDDESSAALLTKISLYFTVNTDLIVKNKVNFAQKNNTNLL